MPIDIEKLRKIAKADSELESAPLGGSRTFPVRGQKQLTIVEQIKENPATLAAGLAMLYPGIGVPAATTIGALARGVDKANLFSDLPSDYSRESLGESLTDIGLTGLVAGLGQYLGSREMPEDVAVSLKKTNIGRHLMDAPAEMGLPAGYKIFDYSKYPGMVERDAYLESIGLPRFIPGPKGSGFEDVLVGNPARNRLAGTPEGEAYDFASSFRDPKLSDDILYSGVIDPSNFDPYIVTPKKIKFSATNENTAKTYSPRRRDIEKRYMPDPYSTDFSMYTLKETIPKTEAYKMLVNDVFAGTFDPTYPPVRSLLAGEQDMYPWTIAGAIRPTVQEFVPFHRRILERDLEGRQITMMDHPQQKADRDYARSKNIEGVIYRDAKDPGPNAAASLPDRGYGKTDVMMTVNPQALKSKYNLGTWDLSDPRILASIAALASGITSVQDNTTTNR